MSLPSTGTITAEEAARLVMEMVEKHAADGAKPAGDEDGEAWPVR